MPVKTAVKRVTRTLDVRADTVDFRDKMFEPTLLEVPSRIELDKYRKHGVPILDQGKEGACTGFGLATVVHYLLLTRKVDSDTRQVSPRMLYEMAKRYDEWPGDDYEGASARGAMKGWHKHGVCNESLWPYVPTGSNGHLTDDRAKDAGQRLLGAYYRVNHKDLVAMHCALAEVGILYASAVVHSGWDRVGQDGLINFEETELGGHAFAIVAYDRNGFWIQNSWGDTWGKDGFGFITYDDWLANGTDVWVARLGVPVALKSYAGGGGRLPTAGRIELDAARDLRPHIISLGNDGRLRESGTFGTSKADVAEIFVNDFRRITQGWTNKRVLLYAHGGLVDEGTAVQRLSDYKKQMLDNEIYPISFIWHSDFWSTITNIISDALHKRRPEGFLDPAKDFLLDRLDDALEPVARALSGRAQWDEMKENALLASTDAEGGVLFALNELNKLLTSDPSIEVHVVAHSAGAILQGPVVQYLTTKGKVASGPMKGKTGLGRTVKTCTLWAPACTIDSFKAAYLPSIKNQSLERFALFTLTDDAEQDDHCANTYHKSLLYLVSNALEVKARNPLPGPWYRDGEPLLGMWKFATKDADISDLLYNHPRVDWVVAPNQNVPGSKDVSTAVHHGDFDDDKATVRATLARILDKGAVGTTFTFMRSASALKDRRLRMDLSMN